MRRHPVVGALLTGMLCLLVPIRPASAVELQPRTASHWFATSSIDLGYKFLRPRLQAGYGIATRQWLGLEANPVLSSRALGAYAGLRLNSRYAELRVGARVVQSTEHSFLPRRNSYTRELAELIVDNKKAFYRAYRVQGRLRWQIFGGLLQPTSELVWLSGVPDNRYVFAETFGVVSGSRFLLRSRLVYRYAVVAVATLQLGIAVENIFLPDRNADIWRMGPVARFQPFDNLSFRFSLLPTISSPDPLGLIGSEFEFGIRWYWLTDG